MPIGLQISANIIFLLKFSAEIDNFVSHNLALVSYDLTGTRSSDENINFKQEVSGLPWHSPPRRKSQKRREEPRQKSPQ